MHVVIRKYATSPEYIDQTRPKLAQLEETMRGLPGFVAYHSGDRRRHYHHHGHRGRNRDRGVDGTGNHLDAGKHAGGPTGSATGRESGVGSRKLGR